MSKYLPSLLLTGLLVFPGTLIAGDTGQPQSESSPSELIEDAANRLVRALELILMAIPQYEAPELLDNGDIIIRRKPRTPNEDPGDKPRATPPERKI